MQFQSHGFLLLGGRDIGLLGSCRDSARLNLFAGRYLGQFEREGVVLEFRLAIVSRLEDRIKLLLAGTVRLVGDIAALSKDIVVLVLETDVLVNGFHGQKMSIFQVMSDFSFFSCGH